LNFKELLECFVAHLTFGFVKCFVKSIYPPRRQEKSTTKLYIPRFYYIPSYLTLFLNNLLALFAASLFMASLSTAPSEVPISRVKPSGFQ
jgi:hypothetical protein